MRKASALLGAAILAVTLSACGEPCEDRRFSHYSYIPVYNGTTTTTIMQPVYYCADEKDNDNDRSSRY